ncbi:MAG TPA: hypothetical protein DCF33_06160 [Saprospirales bacterium]|nr:hypothetical protein [Saprospirales bacterium]
MHTYYTFSLLGLLLFTACDRKKDQPPQTEDFSCIKLYDEQGQDLGIYGNCSTSKDWTNITLTETEKGYLNFSDTVSLAGTSPTTVNSFGIAPCPVTLGGAMLVHVGKDFNSEPVKLKLAVIDEELNVIQKVAVRIGPGNSIHLFVDPALYQTGQYYRMYYQISAQGAPVLFEGYGNFLVCKGPIQVGNIETECM